MRLHYLVKNHNALSLYLLNQLWQNGYHDAAIQEYRVEVPPNLVNIEVQPTAVKMSKEVVDVPYGLLVEIPHMPALLRLAPGAEYAQTLELPLPLLSYTSYESTPARGPLVTRPLHFELGYILGYPHVESALQRLTATTGESIFSIDHFLAKYQSTIGAGPFQEILPVVSQLNPYPPRPACTGKWTPWG